MAANYSHRSGRISDSDIDRLLDGETIVAEMPRDYGKYCAALTAQGRAFVENPSYRAALRSTLRSACGEGAGADANSIMNACRAQRVPTGIRHDPVRRIVWDTYVPLCDLVECF